MKSITLNESNNLLKSHNILNDKNDLLKEIGINYTNINIIDTIDITNLNSKQKYYVNLFKNSIDNELKTILDLFNNCKIVESQDKIKNNKDFNKEFTNHVYYIEEYLETIILMLKSLNIL